MNIGDRFLRKYQFDFWKIGILAVFTVYFLNIASNPAKWSFLDNVNLLTHEAGHFIFMFFGNRFLEIAGGTLVQIFMPAAFILYFYFTDQKFSGNLTMFWLGQNFLSIAVYAGDAVQRALPLLGSDSDGHDWGNMLAFLGLLSYTDFIAATIHAIGIFFIFAAIVCGLSVSRKEAKKVNFSNFI